MAKKKIIGSREKIILKAIGKGLFLASILVAPNLAKLGKLFDQNKYYVEKRIHNLENKGYIFLSGDYIKLTLRGKKLLSIIECEEIEIDKSKKWNGIWQIVAYDVPNDKNQERNFFRDKLKGWGFYKIQKSIWILPYPCQEEIAIVAQSLSINPHVLYFTSRHIPNELLYLKKFGLAEDFIPDKP